MAESVSFELELLASKVVGPAKWAAKAIEDIENRAKRAQKALNFTADMSKVQSQLKKLATDPEGFKSLIRAQKQLADERKKLTQQTFGASLKTSLGLGSSAGLAAGIGAAVGTGIVNVLSSAISGLIDAGKAISGFIVDGFTRGIDVAGQRQALKLGEKLSLGKEGGKEFASDVSRFAGLSGMDDDAIRGLLLPLRRAGFDQKGARSAFAAASDVAAGEGKGGDAGRISGLLEDFQNIQLKGGVRSRQLVGMGVNVKDFYASLSKQLGISTKTAEKQAQQGKIDPQLLLNTIYRQIEKKQGGQLGTGQYAYSKTMQARVNKLKGLPDQFLAELSESSGFQKLSEKLGGLLEALDPDGPRGKRIIASLEKAFNRIVDMIGGPEDAADNIADAVEGIIGAVVELTPLVLKVVGFLIEGAEKIGDLVRGAMLTSKLLSGDTAAAQRIIQEQEAIDAGRRDRAVNREQASYNKAHPEQVTTGAPGPWADTPSPFKPNKAHPEQVTTGAPGPWADTPSPFKPNKGNKGGASVTAPVQIDVHMGSGEGDEAAGRRTAQTVGRHVTNELEKAQQQGGG